MSNEYKSCNKCKQLKALCEFHRHGETKDGLRPECKTCRAELDRLRRSIQPKRPNLWARRNPKSHNAKNRAWDRAHPAQATMSKVQYAQRNPEKVRVSKKTWALKNVPSINANTARRRAFRLRATPLWLTNEHHQEIKEIYTVARDLSWLSIDGLQVDHIIPLQSKKVCGLHVPWNLQILPSSMNRSKSNKL